jgi:hypothetical protein
MRNSTKAVFLAFVSPVLGTVSNTEKDRKAKPERLQESFKGESF